MIILIAWELFSSEGHPTYLAKYKNMVLVQQNSAALLPISEFVLDEMFQRNASKFAIFYIYENPKLLFPFFISCYFIYMST